MEVYGRLAQAARPAREYAAAFFRWLLLGAVVGASESTVVRFATEIGYSG